MSPLRIAYYVFWIVPNVITGVLVGTMAIRKMFRTLPCFFAYASFDVLSSTALFAIYHTCSFVTYFLVFWPVLGVRLLLGLLVIREVILYVFNEYEALHQLSSLILRWVFIVLLLLAILSAAVAPGADSDRLLAGLFVLERSVRLIQVGLLLFLFLFSQFLGLSWRTYAFGVALGFGVLASVQLAALAIRTRIGPLSGDAFNLIVGAGQTCAVLIWCVYLLTPQRHKAIEVLPKKDLAEWNEALREALHR